MLIDKEVEKKIRFIIEEKSRFNRDHSEISETIINMLKTCASTKEK